MYSSTQKFHFCIFRPTKPTHVVKLHTRPALQLTNASFKNVNFYKYLTRINFAYYWNFIISISKYFQIIFSYKLSYFWHNHYWSITFHICYYNSPKLYIFLMDFCVPKKFYGLPGDYLTNNGISEDYGDFCIFYYFYRLEIEKIWKVGFVRRTLYQNFRYTLIS